MRRFVCHSRRYGSCSSDTPTGGVAMVQVEQQLAKFGVLLLGELNAQSAQQADRLRSAAIPAWTASTDFEVHWLLQRASVSASITLVDLRRVDAYREEEIERFVLLASEAMLPVVLVGASDDEARSFGEVIAKLSAGATDDDVADVIAAMKRFRS
ncbi:MAG TPA: hypothetical protein VM261_34565 [Kofleriaceae bacterium]|nr:hypothetical protein [Kofleriaceae bacterium]